MKWRFIMFACLLLATLLPRPSPAYEATALEARYRGYEMSNNFYEQYEVKPGANALRLQPYARQQGVLSYGPAATRLRNRSRAQDSHEGLRFYLARTCVSCHPGQAGNNLHVTRNSLLCRQCHGGEPIPGNDFYYSAMNDMRRHAYVCSKCHEGASMSFATYVVHEPPPGDMATAASFPALYWGFWIMMAIAGLTFLLFLPHTALWFLRELKGRKAQGGES